MKSKYGSLQFKLGIVYVSLMIINISIFSTIVYENQVELIAENNKLKSAVLITDVIHVLQNFSYDLDSRRIFKVLNFFITKVNLC